MAVRKPDFNGEEKEPSLTDDIQRDYLERFNNFLFYVRQERYKQVHLQMEADDALEAPLNFIMVQWKLPPHTQGSRMRNPVRTYRLCMKSAWTCLFLFLAALAFCEISITRSLHDPSLLPFHPPSNDACLLAAEYRFNSLAADARYKDIPILVTGEVVRVGREADGTPYIILSSTSEDMPMKEGVTCQFPDEEETRVALRTLMPGNLVVLEGECEGLRGKIVVLRDCVYPLRGPIWTEGLLAVTLR